WKWRECTPRTPGSYKRAHSRTVRSRDAGNGAAPAQRNFAHDSAVMRFVQRCPSERGGDIHFLDDGAGLVDDLHLDAAAAARAGDAARGSELGIGGDLELRERVQGGAELGRHERCKLRLRSAARSRSFPSAWETATPASAPPPALRPSPGRRRNRRAPRPRPPTAPNRPRTAPPACPRACAPAASSQPRSVLPCPPSASP